MTNDLTSRRCGYCKGRKRVLKSEYGISTIGCPVCKSTGVVNVPQEYFVCGRCDGTGRVLSGYASNKTSVCEVCEGKGWSNPD